MRCARRRSDNTRTLASGEVILAAIVSAFASSCGDGAMVRFAEADAGEIDAEPAPTDAPASPSDGGAHLGQRSPFRVSCTEKPCAVGLSADSVAGSAFCALLDDGRVACWGSNTDGVLGRPAEDGGSPDAIGLPGFVEGVSGAIAIASTCVLLADGTVRCWGAAVAAVPFTGVTRLVKGYTNRCAVVGPLEWSCVEGVYAPGPDGGAPALYPERSFRAPPGSPLREVFVGNVVSSGWLASDATLLLREDGTLLSAGSRNFIGRETSLSPVDPHFSTVALANVTDIDVGDCVCAIADGKAYCWGSRSTEVYPVDALPQHVGFPEPLVRVSAVGFSEGAFRRLCAIGASGAVYCSGPNSAGQAGDGTRMTAFVPVHVKELKEPAVDIVAARTSTCALVVSGKIYCWGSGGAGALGNGFAKDELTPLLVNLP